jgi:hypothetical protein
MLMTGLRAVMGSWKIMAMAFDRGGGAEQAENRERRGEVADAEQGGHKAMLVDGTEIVRMV